MDKQKVKDRVLSLSLDKNIYLDRNSDQTRV